MKAKKRVKQGLPMPSVEDWQFSGEGVKPLPDVSNDKVEKGIRSFTVEFQKKGKK